VDECKPLPATRVLRYDGTSLTTGLPCSLSSDTRSPSCSITNSTHSRAARRFLLRSKVRRAGQVARALMLARCASLLPAASSVVMPPCCSGAR